jgi:hypothetical protein
MNYSAAASTHLHRVRALDEEEADWVRALDEEEADWARTGLTGSSGV